MKIEIIIDPLKKFTNHSHVEIYDTLGYLPSWVINEEYFDKDLFTALDAQYCCGLYESDFVTISEDGVYKYKDDQGGEDPELYPLIKITRGKEIFYQYKYGLVSIINENKESFNARMD